MSPNAGGGWGVAGSQPMSTAVQMEPNKLMVIQCLCHFLCKRTQHFFFIFFLYLSNYFAPAHRKFVFIYFVKTLMCFHRAAFAIFMLDQAVYKHTLRAVCWQKAENIPRGPILGCNPEKSLKSFPPYYSQSPL
jgi:hypothetical protein